MARGHTTLAIGRYRANAVAAKLSDRLHHAVTRRRCVIAHKLTDRASNSRRWQSVHITVTRAQRGGNMSKAQCRLIGRQWATTQIAAWYRSDEPAMLVTGAAGTGKTTLLANLSTALASEPTGHAVRAVHLCRTHVIGSTDPMRVLASIAAQIAVNVPGYTAALNRLDWIDDGTGETDPARIARSVVLNSMSPSVAFERALRRPMLGLSAGDTRHPDVVAIIDGLDERPQALTCALSECLRDPLPGLRLLLSTRPGPPLHLLGELPRLDLVADCPAGVDDMGAYLATAGLTLAERERILALANGSYP